MSEQEIYERLNEVFRNVFDDDDIEVEAGTTADDIEDWDSLEHINLISAVKAVGFGFKMQMFHRLLRFALVSFI